MRLTANTAVYLMPKGNLQLANVPVPKPAEPPADITIDANANYFLEISVAIIDRISDACAARNCELVVMAFGKFIRPASRDMQL